MRWLERIPLAALLFAASALAQVASLDEEERAVLAGAIQQTRLDGTEKWVMVEDRLATLECNATSMINVGGCGGMRRKAQSEDDVMAFLAKEFPAASPGLLGDFRTKAESGGTVHAALPMPVKQVLWGRVDGKWGAVAGGPPPKENPDYMFNVSRVGFDPEHREALAYVAGVSWSDPKRQYGEYVYLRKDKDRWVVEKRARVWELARSEAPKS